MLRSLAAQAQKAAPVELTMTFSAAGCTLAYPNLIETSHVNVCRAPRLMLFTAAQVFLEIPMRLMTYSGSDKKDRFTFALIAATNARQQFSCYAFKCDVPVCH